MRALSIALGLAAAILAAGCQSVRPGRVTVVAIADTCPTNGFAMVRTTNTDALSAAGYLPVIIPRIADTNLLAAAMDRADALLLVGGVKERIIGDDEANARIFVKHHNGWTV